MSEPLPTPEPEERPPWWWKIPFARAVVYYILLRKLYKALKDPNLPADMEAFSKTMETGLRILQGKEEQEP